MIGRLRGQVVERNTDGSCIIDVSGVGYEVFVPLGTLGRFAALSGPVTVFVHTHVREDILTLYGFDGQEDREAFRALLSVSGIGPKIALAVLSTMNAAELARAIATEDKGRFRGIPGVGKKTAERLVLELRDKLPAAATTKTTAAPVSEPLAMVARALVQMGYRQAEAERAVTGLKGATEDKPMEALLRDALAQLS